MLTKEYAKRNLVDQINLQLGITIKHLSETLLQHATAKPQQRAKSKEKQQMGTNPKIHDSRSLQSSGSVIEKLSPGKVLKEKQQQETWIHEELIELEDINSMETVMLNNKQSIPIPQLQEYEMLNNEIVDLDLSMQNCFMKAEQLQNKIVSESWFVGKNTKKLNSIEADISKMVHEMQQMKHEHKSLTLKQKIYMTKIRRLKVEPLSLKQ